MLKTLNIDTWVAEPIHRAGSCVVQSPQLQGFDVRGLKMNEAEQRALKAVIAANAVFRRAPRHVVEGLERLASPRKFARGDDVIKAGGAASSVHIVSQGRAKARITARNGKEIAFRELRHGDLFGEISVLTGRPRAADIVALSDLRTYEISAGDFRRICLSSPDIAAASLDYVARQVQNLSNKLLELSLVDVRGRIHAELARRAKSARVRDGVAVIENAPSHEEFAAFVGTHREAVTRELSRLVKEGVISTGRRRIIVHQAERLAALGEQALDFTLAPDYRPEDPSQD